MVRFGAILQDKYRIPEGFTVQRLLMVGCGTKGAKIGTSCLKCDGWKSYQLGTINKDEVPETFPATKTGLTGTGTPTAAGITSVGTCSNGTDVIGASTVQNCAAEFGKDVDPAAAMVSGADWPVNCDGTVGVGHRTSWLMGDDRTEEICCGNADGDVDWPASGSVKCPTSLAGCWSSVTTKLPPPAAAAGINTPAGDKWPAGDITSTAVADVNNLAYSMNTQQNHRVDNTVLFLKLLDLLWNIGLLYIQTYRNLMYIQ